MEKIRVYASVFFSFSLICIAVSLMYFSYALLKTVAEAPGLITKVKETAKVIDPVLDEVENITRLIPNIIDEIGLIREKIPPILTEVEALRLQIPAIISEVEKIHNIIPSILAEVKQVRKAIAPVIKEVANVRGQIPSIVAESKGYRQLIPDVLAEVEATREMIPETMEKAEKLIAEASNAGQEASEGAVTGFFTGLLKAPLKIVGAGKSALAASKILNEKDLEIVTAVALDVLNKEKVGGKRKWENKRSGLNGTVRLLKEYQSAGRLCRTVDISTLKKGKLLDQRESSACLNENGQWEILGN